MVAGVRRDDWAASAGQAADRAPLFSCAERSAMAAIVATVAVTDGSVTNGGSPCLARDRATFSPSSRS
jgi:hypothetical protein